jgi:hypothetical protein
MNVNVDSAQLEPHQFPSIQAVLNYLTLTGERPRTYTDDPAPGGPRSTVVSESHVLPIYDLRSAPSSASLDREGFALIRHDTAVKNFWDDDEVKAVYYPEVVDALKQATGADRVFIFDHSTRRRIPGAEDTRRPPPAGAQGSRRPHGKVRPPAGPRPHSRRGR